MNLPAAELYMFEDALEQGASAHLLANGFNDLKKQRDADGLSTPRVEVKVLWNGFSPEHYWLNQVTGQKWIDYGLCNLVFKIVTKRNEPGQNHARIRGSLRGLMALEHAIAWYYSQGKTPPWPDFQTLASRMTNHYIVRCLEAGTVPDFKQDERHDISAISFAVTMGIVPSKFPQT